MDRLTGLNLVLINQARVLYGRILTEVVSTCRPNAVRSVSASDRNQLRFSHTDRPSSVKKMFIIWPNKKSKEQKMNTFIFFPAGVQACSFSRLKNLHKTEKVELIGR